MTTLADIARITHLLNGNVQSFRAEIAALNLAMQKAAAEIQKIRADIAELKNNNSATRDHLAGITEIVCSNKPAPYLQHNLAPFNPRSRHDH